MMSVAVDAVAQGSTPARRRRRAGRGAFFATALAVAGGALAISVRTSPDGSVPEAGPAGSDLVTAEVPAVVSTVAPTVVAVEAPVTETPTAPPTAAAATTVAPTGSVQSCDELHRFVDDDGDAWGECVPDADGAHVRAQAIVKFLGYTELTCSTDPADASSVCEALSSDGAVHEVAIAMTGDLGHDTVIRPAPTTTTTTAPPPPPRPVAALPANDCDPNYSGCVPIDSDVDCAGGSGNGPSYVSGPVRVIGSDIYGLDRDDDGYGCE